MINRIKFYLYSGSAIVGVAAMVVLVFWTIFRVLPESDKAIGVRAIDGYSKATESAMDNINGWVGCKVFVPGDAVIVKSEDGAPCGDPWRPEDEWDHAATAYRCNAARSEIFISKPGNINTQACIIQHELGHILGLQHHRYGAMANCLDPANDQQNVLKVRDADVAKLKKEFCEK